MICSAKHRARNGTSAHSEKETIKRDGEVSGMPMLNHVAEATRKQIDGTGLTLQCQDHLPLRREPLIAASNWITRWMPKRATSMASLTRILLWATTFCAIQSSNYSAQVLRPSPTTPYKDGMPHIFTMGPWWNPERRRFRGAASSQPLMFQDGFTFTLFKNPKIIIWQ